MTEYELIQNFLQLRRDFWDLPREGFLDKVSKLRKEYKEAHGTDSNAGFNARLDKFIADADGGMFHRAGFPKFSEQKKKTSSSSTDKEEPKTDARQAAKFTLKDAVNYYEQKDEKEDRIDVSAEVWKKRTYKKMFSKGSIYTTKCEIQRSKK